MRKNIFLILIIILLMSVFSGCFGGKKTIGIIDHKKVLDDSGYGAQLNELQSEAEKFDASLADKRETLRKEFAQKEKEANEKMQSVVQERMKSKAISLERQVQERNKDFVAAKEKEMREYVATVEKETNDKLDELAKQTQRFDIKEDERKNLESQAAYVKSEATKKIYEKDVALKKEVQDKLTPEYEAMRPQMDAYSQEVQKEVYEQQSKELREYAEKMLGDDQRKQNELKEKIAALLKDVDTKINEAVEAVAKQKKLEIVFTSAIGKQGAVNITDDVVKYLKEQNPAKKDDKAVPVKDDAAKKPAEQAK